MPDEMAIYFDVLGAFIQSGLEIYCSLESRMWFGNLFLSFCSYNFSSVGFANYVVHYYRHALASTCLSYTCFLFVFSQISYCGVFFFILLAVLLLVLALLIYAVISVGRKYPGKFKPD